MSEGPHVVLVWSNEGRRPPLEPRRPRRAAQAVRGPWQPVLWGGITGFLFFGGGRPGVSCGSGAGELLATWHVGSSPWLLWIGYSIGLFLLLAASSTGPFLSGLVSVVGSSLGGCGCFNGCLGGCAGGSVCGLC